MLDELVCSCQAINPLGIGFTLSVIVFGSPYSVMKRSQPFHHRPYLSSGCEKAIHVLPMTWVMSRTKPGKRDIEGEWHILWGQSVAGQAQGNSEERPGVMSGTKWSCRAGQCSFLWGLPGHILASYGGCNKWAQSLWLKITYIGYVTFWVSLG